MYRLPQSQKDPWVRKRDPWVLSLPELTEIVRVLSPLPLPPPPFVLRNHVDAQNRAARLLTQRNLVPVDRALPPPAPPPPWTVHPRLHLIDADDLPAQPHHPRPTSIRWLNSWIVTVHCDYNPKIGKGKKRFALYRSGMTIRDYLLACEAAGYGYSHRGDIIFDWERGYIRVWRPDGTEVTPDDPFRDSLALLTS